MKQESVCRTWKVCAGKGRRRLYQKVLAASLSVAIAISLLPANIMPAAAAAKPYVSMRTTFKTLQIGQKNRMTLKNNTAGWKIQKISTNDKSIAAVSEKTEKSFQIQGKKIGRTTVKAVLKTTSRKKHTSKTVRCRVNVIAAEDTVPTPEPEEQTPVTEAEVSTQEQLDQALLNASLKKLTIASENATKFVIPAGSYKNVSLIVNTPAADIENSGVFQSVEIRAVKPDTWFEKAVGNVMRVTAKAARIIVNSGAHMKELAFSQPDADVKLEVNGKADQIRIQSKMNLDISGKPEDGLSVSVEQTAADAKIVSETPLELSLHTAATLTFEKGAEGSVVSLVTAGIKAAISNLTSKIISVKRPNGTTTNVNTGQKDMQISSDAAQNTGSTSSGSYWGTGSGSTSGSGSGSGTDSGSDSDTEDTNKNGIPTPSMEDIQKGVESVCEAITIGKDGDNSRVYWKTYYVLKEGVTFFEDRPELEMQYSIGVGDQRRWYSDVGAISTFPNKNSEYKLAGNTKKTSSMRAYFRFADKETETGGEEIEVSIQTWNEEVLGQYLRDYINIREPENREKPFSIKIPVSTIQGNGLVMAYDKEKKPSARELVELPQWTGDGPKIPKIQAEESLKAITVDEIKATLIISGSSVENLQDLSYKGRYYFKVDVPITPLDVPPELPNGKFQWNDSVFRGDFKDLEEKKAFRFVFAKNDQFSGLTMDSYIEEKKIDMVFCYETEGGEKYTPEPLHEGEEATDKGIDESEISLVVYDKDLEDKCIKKLEEALGSLSGGPQDVSYQFTITGFGIEGTTIKAVDTTVIDMEPIDSTQIKDEEWKSTYQR